MKKALIVLSFAVWRARTRSDRPGRNWRVDGEWKHRVGNCWTWRGHSRGQILLASSAGVRSTSEVYMHIALANFYLLV